MLSAARIVLRRRRAISFAGRTVVISGGSRGLGLELARLFAAEGARLVLLARDSADLDRAAKELQSRSAQVLLVLAISEMSIALLAVPRQSGSGAVWSTC